MNDSQTKINQLVMYLRQMRLPVMADHLRDAFNDKTFHQMTSLELLDILITEKYQNRRYNTIQRYLKRANLSQPNARLDKIDYFASRKLNKELFDQLKTYQVVDHHRNVIIQGATGTGKSLHYTYKSRHIKKIDILLT